MKITDEDIEWIRMRYRDSKHSTSSEKMEMLNILSQCMAISKREVAKIILGSWLIPDDEFDGIDLGFYGEVKVSSKVKDRHAKMLELYNQGLSDGQIAQRMYVDKNTVKYWRNSRRLKAHSAYINQANKRKKKILDLHSKGFSNLEISELVGVHRNTVNYVLRKEKNNG